MRLPHPIFAALILPLALLACEDTPSSPQGVGFGSYSAYQQRQQAPAPTVMAAAAPVTPATGTTPTGRAPVMAGTTTHVEFGTTVTTTNIILPEGQHAQPASPLPLTQPADSGRGWSGPVMANGVPTYQASLAMAMSGIGSQATQLSVGLDQIGNYGAARMICLTTCRADQTVPFAVSDVSGKIKRVDVEGQPYAVIVGVRYKGRGWVSIEPYLLSVAAQVAQQTGCMAAGTASYNQNTDVLILPLHC